MFCFTFEVSGSDTEDPPTPPAPRLRCILTCVFSTFWRFFRYLSIPDEFPLGMFCFSAALTLQLYAYFAIDARIPFFCTQAQKRYHLHTPATLQSNSNQMYLIHYRRSISHSLLLHFPIKCHANIQAQVSGSFGEGLVCEVNWSDTVQSCENLEFWLTQYPYMWIDKLDTWQL